MGCSGIHTVHLGAWPVVEPIVNAVRLCVPVKPLNIPVVVFLKTRLLHTPSMQVLEASSKARNKVDLVSCELHCPSRGADIKNGV